MTHRYILDGQPLVYNAERKLGNLTIEEPFLKAGKIFGFKGSGIGLNPSIIKFIVKREAVLMVYVASFHQNYWISWDWLEVHKKKNYQYKAGGHKWVFIIPLNQFSEKCELIPA